VHLGRTTFAIFVVLQIADGLMTFGAVRIFGTGAEGNPILATWIQVAGPGVTLLAAKASACGLAAVLYRHGRQKTLAVLTGGLLCAAVGPWLAVLAGMLR
jgi:type IV secretory pathway VirB6-like protein